MVEPGTTGDERRYAEALVTKLGTRLDAPLYDLSAVDVCRPVLPHLPLPFAAHSFHAVSAEHSRIHAAWHVDAYFSGTGGDHVFCSLRRAAPLADVVRSEERRVANERGITSRFRWCPHPS